VAVQREEYHFAIMVAIYLFIFFYPMLISIYVFLPLFIGAMSYALVKGLERGKGIYLFVAVVYLINLEVNLSLPLFLTMISSFIFYVVLYPLLKHFHHCLVCKRIISVVLLDLLYLGALFFFDFVFDMQSVVLDTILLYSLVVDILIVMLL
jgi:hypothetical protein